MVLAYQSLIQDLKSTVENDSKENVRLQGQLQVSNSLIECMRTATLSSGLHMMFSNETCPLVTPSTQPILCVLLRAATLCLGKDGECRVRTTLAVRSDVR